MTFSCVLRSAMRSVLPTALAALVYGAVLAPPPLVAQGADMELVRRGVERAALPFGRWPNISDVVPDLRRVYDSVAWQPIWTVGGQPTASARAVVTYLATLELVGLHTSDFDVSYIDSLVRAVDRGMAAPQLVGRLDITLSVSVARVLSALQWGRIKPRDAHEAFRIPRTDFDLAVGVLGAARAADPSLVFDGAEPGYVHYRMLKRQLARIRVLAHDTTLLPISLPKRLAPGDMYAGAPALRRLLIALGDLSPDSTREPTADTMYSGDLVEGVKRFQRRQGAAQDGIVGPGTRERLNRPFDQGVQQVELALERWRWLPRQFGGRVIIVNIPEFRLHAFDRLTSDSTALFSMDVVVGEAYDHATPVFMKDLEYLSFSPYWEVPKSIARKEIRPNAMRDPSYLVRNRYVLVKGDAESSPMVASNAANIAAIGATTRVRQLPGDQNSLGRVKFMLPNPHNIYLHDTPTQSAFDRVRRDLSHGCIRLVDPKSLALWVLRDQPEWTSEKVDSAMSRESPLNVRTSEKIPVLILYSTAVAQLDGELRLYRDIYGHDKRLIALLARGFPYSR